MRYGIAGNRNKTAVFMSLNEFRFQGSSTKEPTETAGKSAICPGFQGQFRA